MEKFSDNIKKVILAGIGAVAVTAEKSKDLLDEMAEKGELTVEQGKVLNEELSDLLDKLTPEQLAALKEQLLQKESAEENEDA